jgi:methylated-DNA-[protein]-cysteine S-methyltransferase
VTKLHHRVNDSPVGPILLSATTSGRLTCVRLRRAWSALEAGWGGGDGDCDGDGDGDESERGGDSSGPVLEAVAAQLVEYFQGRRSSFDVPLELAGSPFQLQVWAQLQQIPFGTTVSYSQLAAQLGRPGTARAVGHANARNPIAIIVPCHRVIGSSGRLTGYGGGLDAKQFLLALESGGINSPDRNP